MLDRSKSYPKNILIPLIIIITYYCTITALLLHYLPYADITLTRRNRCHYSQSSLLPHNFAKLKWQNILWKLEK